MADIQSGEVKWQELTKSECFELLAHEHLGRVAVSMTAGRTWFPSTSSSTGTWWCSARTRA